MIIDIISILISLASIGISIVNFRNLAKTEKILKDMSQLFVDITAELDYMTSDESEREVK